MGQEFGTIEAGKPTSITTGLSKLVQDRFTWCRNLRFLQQEKWLSAKMAFDGIDYYGSDEEANQSGIFLNFTQMKTMSAYSQIMSTMTGPQGYPWDIKPTTDPELVNLGFSTNKEAEKTNSISQDLVARITQANIACDNMQIKIKDNLEETHWEEKFASGVLDMVILGTMVVKGPFSAPPEAKKWMLVDEEDEEGGVINKIKSVVGVSKTKRKVYKLVSSNEDPRPDFEIVSPFEFYPDPSAFNIEDCMWVVHRRVLNKSQLVDLSKVDGFRPEEIEKCLDAYPKGNWTAETWESRVYALNQRQTPLSRGDRFVALEYWGYVSGRELELAGVDMPNGYDKHKQYMACIWSIGSYCIKIAISQLEKPYIPFLVCPYEKVLYNIWGRGIPEKMRDPQDIVNAAARAMVDNMGIAAGPQVIYDTSRMINGFKFEGIKPWGVWPLKTLEGITSPPVTFVPVPSILQELKLLQDNFKMFIQEVTSMPDMASGYAGSSTGQHNRTASGMSMLFSAANTYIKGVVFNIDNSITKPMIRRMYDWNMQYSTDIMVKGDFNISAGGVQRIIQNESKQGSMQELLQLMQDPDFKPYINKIAILKEYIRIHGLNDTDMINSDEQAQQIKQNMMQQEAQMEQMKNVPTLRAEMPRPDALIQMLQNTDPSSPVYPAIYEQVALSQDAMSPSMKLALDIAKAQTLATSQQQLQLPEGLATKAKATSMDFERAGGFPSTAPEVVPEVPAQQGLPPQQPLQQQGMPLV
jgi:hypothetical protein